MIEPVDPACLRSSLVRLTGQEVAHVQRQGPDREQIASITYSTASYRTNLAQVVRRDSSVYLVAEFGRVHQEFVADQADSAISALSDLVLGVRDSCGGSAPSGVRDLIMWSSTPSYEAWFAPGTTARVSVQRAMDRYRLQVDTLARPPGTSVGTSTWVALDRVRIAVPPKGYAVATGCWRGDSLPEGIVVALVRNAKNDPHGDIVQVWQLDGSTLRFSSGPAAGVQCRKQSWKF
jgi:hypothetical protein